MAVGLDDAPAQGGKGDTMSVGTNDITIDHDFQGGLTLATSAVKNGLIAAIDVGLVGKPEATEILFLIREAMQTLLDRMTD